MTFLNATFHNFVKIIHIANYRYAKKDAYFLAFWLNWILTFHHIYKNLVVGVSNCPYLRFCLNDYNSRLWKKNYLNCPYLSSAGLHSPFKHKKQVYFFFLNSRYQNQQKNIFFLSSSAINPTLILNLMPKKYCNTSFHQF